MRGKLFTVRAVRHRLPREVVDATSLKVSSQGWSRLGAI